MDESKEYTTIEIRKQFLDQVRTNIKYWNELSAKSQEERLSGLAFSILSTIDGCTFLPGFILSPCPDPSDKEYNIENGADYYPEGGKCDIAGGLHEHLYPLKCSETRAKTK